MKKKPNVKRIPQIWTIGHSTRTIEEFIRLLNEYKIEMVLDVRHYPNSRHFPHFNRDRLAQSLAAAGIGYEHLVELGGRRNANPDSHNLAWRNSAFRGYADYMETQPFAAGIKRLLEFALSRRCALMCAEAVWWRCHRSLLSDYFKSHGATVLHILGANKVQEHPYTTAAKIVNGKLSYEK
jgi:uncharacterized protein (DUF488 family)